MTQMEKFNIDMELTVEDAKNGNIEFARQNFYRGMNRAEQEMSGEDQVKARTIYTKVYNKYLA